VRSKGCPRHLAVSPPRFFGRSANWIPLSVSTVWMRLGTAPTSASRRGSGRLHIGLVNEFDHSELRGPVNGHEEVELAFGRSHFGQIDMEEADRIDVEHLLPGLVSLDLR